MTTSRRCDHGFTLIEMFIGVMMLGVVLVAFAGIFALFQKSATQSRQFANSQQNARVALDHLTDNLRQAGARSDYINGQKFVAHAGPYQIAINADIDRGETLGGEEPLSALVGPYDVPGSGTAIYNVKQTYNSPAETVVLTLDSDSDGGITSSDHGDDPEESGTNTNLYVLLKRSYGAKGSKNEVRSANLAIIRGPGAYPNGSYPLPLYRYYYDHDRDMATADILWGDGDNNGNLSDGEIATLGPMPDSLLMRIRKIQITVTSESDQYNPKFAHNGGYLSVEMRSEVMVRNAVRRAFG